MPLEPPLCLQALFQYTAQNGNDYTTTLTIDESSYQAYSRLSGESYVRSFYTGLNVAAGMYATSNLNGQVFRIKSITSQTDDLVIAILEDVDGLNKLIDTDGRGNGVPAIGTGYIFELNSDGIPALTAIRNPPPTTTFPDSIMGRFHYDNLKVNKTQSLETYCVAVGLSTNNYFATSLDGITWTARGKGPFTTAVNNVAYNGTIWVAVGEGTNTIATSTDGITWTGCVNLVDVRARGIAWNGNIWVAVGEGTEKIAISSDGINWSSPAGTSTLPGCNAVAWNGSLFVLGTSGGSVSTRIYTSSNGSSWTARTIPSGMLNILTVAWGGNVWVAGGLRDTNAGSPNTIITSPDGINWTGRGTTMPVAVRDVAYNGSVWVAVGGNRSISVTTSTPNGESWTPRGSVFGSSGLNTQGESITWNGSLWVGVGDGDNEIVTSQNGTNWTTQQTGSGIFSGGRPLGVSSRFGYPYALPNKRLVVTERGSAIVPSIYQKDSPATGFFFPSTHTLSVSTAGSERMRISNAGNIGIGTTNPTNFLHIQKGSYSVPASGSDGTTFGLNLGSSNYTDQAKILCIDSTTSGGVWQGDLAFNTSFNVGASTEKLRITGLGNVGIGTNRPQNFLHIQKGNYSNGTSFGLNLGSSNYTDQAKILCVDTTTNGITSGVLAFNTSSAGGASTEKLRITGLGNVGIGTTNPTNFLHIQKGDYSAPPSGSDGNTFGINFGSSNYTDQAKILCVDSTAGAWQGDLALYTSYNVGASTEKLRITGLGNVGIGTNRPTQRLDVNGTIRGLGNIVNVQTASANANKSTSIFSWIYIASGPLDICTITYTPKQTGTVTIVVYGSVEIVVGNSTGADGGEYSIYKDTTTLSSYIIYYNNTTVDNRSNNYFGQGVATTTITGPTTFKITLATYGDATLGYKNAYLVLHELSNAT